MKDEDKTMLQNVVFSAKSLQCFFDHDFGYFLLFSLFEMLTLFLFQSSKNPSTIPGLDPVSTE